MQEPNAAVRDDKLEKVKALIAEIEAEMKARGFWQERDLEPEKYAFELAFGADTMAFSQWLQFIFLRNVKMIVDSGSQLPAVSQVGVQALREFDGQPAAEKLVELLNEFDKVVEGTA